MSGLPAQGPPPPDVTRAPVFVGVLSAFYALSALFFIARIYTRIFTVKKFWWDDGVLVFAFIVSTTEYATQMVQTQHGYGKHVAYVSPSDLTLNGEIGYAAQLMWVWAVTLVKVSMCLLLLRIRPSWYCGMMSFLVFQLVIALATTVIHFIRCHPIEANWNPMLPHARCWSVYGISTSYWVLSALFVATDFTFAILPLSFINKIRRPMREKVVLVFLMGFGLFASACALAKIALIKLNPIIDPTYDPINLGIWAHLEVFIGFIAACVPCLKAPFERTLVSLGLLKRDDEESYDSFSKVVYSKHPEKDPNMRLNKIEDSPDDFDGSLISSRMGKGSV